MDRRAPFDSREEPRDEQWRGELPSPLMKTGEVEQLLQVSRTTVWAWTRQGILPAVKVGRVVRYRRDDVIALMDRTA